MKLIKLNPSAVSETKDVPGLLNCRVDYEVKSATGRLDYTGPAIAPDMWHQVLSFFRWTHKETQSESQVRLYVNHQLGRWGAWAFPQEARTGMTARELPTQETPEQAWARFASWQSEPSDDWLYFGTAHHHCSASAFQSSTDEQNERNQDGLHLTVGRMDAEHHEVHARFYLGGNAYEPDLSRFWGVDPGLAALLPPEVLPLVARFQMGAKVTVDFPDAWRANLVEVREERRERREMIRPPRWQLELPELEHYQPHRFRLEDALEDIQRLSAHHGFTEQQWLAELGRLAADDVSQVLFTACLEHGVQPDELLAELATAETVA
ncbi:MAG: hypothetical protein EBU23_08965 [Mycobacteriaceae bacterium]|nr:hypothetical protein [Mycobacteriaceae bacterium]NBQ42643.1 hypothetical protein [Mycobacteriaceae bacterium]